MSDRMKSGAAADTLSFLEMPGEAAMLMRDLDWTSSPLGRPADWPEALRLVVTLMLASKFPMFVAWGPELGFLYNDAYAEILAEKHPAAMGRPFHDTWVEIWDDIAPLIDATLSGEAVYRDNLPLTMHRKGFDEETWFTFSYSPVRDDDGAIAGVFCACVETTDRVIAERALRESERRLKLAIDGANIGTWDWDLTTSRGSWSPRTMEILGATSGSDITPEQRTATIHPDDRERVWQEYREAWRTGEGVISEYRAVRPDGEVRWISSRGAFDTDAQGNRVRTVGIVIDVTESKLAEERLRRLNDTLEAQVEQRSAERELLWRLSQDMLARADYQGMMSAVSPAWSRVLGWSEEDLLSRGYAAFMHPDDEPVTLDALARMGETGLPIRYENRIATSDGGYKPIEWTVTPEPGGKNFIAVGRDLSEAKARQDELERTQEALRQAHKMEAVGQLTGGLAHDFNNLLMGVSGALELMRRRLEQGRVEETGKYIEMAETGVSRAAALTHRLLSFSRRQTLDPRPADLRHVIADIADLLQRSVGPQIAIDLAGVGDVWPTLLDRNQFENALINLCINARDAMPDGGSIRLEAVNEAIDEATAEPELPCGDFVRISVVDGGTGMSAETAARAFDPFYTTKPMGQGTGLGLSMVYGFVRQSGGQIRIRSEVGRGTRVDLYFPRSQGEAGTEKAPQAAPVARSSDGERVLVVDDEAIIRGLVAETLTDLGYQVFEAGDGSEALGILRDAGDIALLVTDVGLPGGMNGRQLADAARAHQPGLKVMFITGYAESAVIGDHQLGPGMSVLVKPFEIEALARRAREMIDGLD